MDNNLFKIVGAIAGIGGIGLASVVYIFREIIRKEIFPQLTKEQAYKLLNRIVILTFTVGFSGIIAYVIVSSRSGALTSTRTPDEQRRSPTPVVPNVVQTPSQAPTKIENRNKARSAEAPSPVLPTVRLSGFVVDENEKPLPGAKISIDDFADMKPVETASNGSFTLDNIHKQNREMIRIRVSLAGYVTITRDVVIGSYPRRITLEKTK